MGAVVLANDVVLVMGGYSNYGFVSDVWKSLNFGANWILVTSGAPWTGNNVVSLLYLSSPVLRHTSRAGSVVYVMAPVNVPLLYVCMYGSLCVCVCVCVCVISCNGCWWSPPFSTLLSYLFQSIAPPSSHNFPVCVY